MFIDRIIEGWNHYTAINNRPDVIKRIFGDFVDPLNIWEKTRVTLNEAIVFNVNNVSEFIQNQGLHIPKDVPNTRPQYDSMWFEFSNTRDIDSPDIIAMAYDDGHWIERARQQQDYTKTYGVLLHCDKVDENKILSSSLVFRETGEKDYFRVNNFVGWACDENGALLDELYYFSPYFREAVKSDGGKLVELRLKNILARPLMAISLMHCKNVTFQSHEPPSKLQRARLRRDKLPLFTFKTLEIRPMVKILRDEGGSETHGLARALHICRGHFKDYSQGPGLGRGHAKGLYWWDSMVRGSREVGAVIKDYKVSP